LMRACRPPICRLARLARAAVQFFCLASACSCASDDFLAASASSARRFLKSASCSATDLGPEDFAAALPGAAPPGAAAAAGAGGGATRLGTRSWMGADLVLEGQGDCEYTVLPPAPTHL